MYSLLIVDDEQAILEGMKHILDWSSYGIDRIETARSYGEGQTRAIDLHPDICLFDVCIGHERGYELVSRLQELGLKSNYIMMSGYGEFRYAIASMRVGAREYLLKPVETEKLRAVVEKIIVNELGGHLPNQRPDERETDPVLMLPYESFPPLIGKTLMIVRAEYGQKITLKTTADKFRMNATYLGQLFLKETQMKFSAYLMIYRLVKARQRIEDSNDKISTIAEEVGYSNLNYFYTHFHNYYGITPSEMRTRADLNRELPSENKING